MLSFCLEVALSVAWWNMASSDLEGAALGVEQSEQKSDTFTVGTRRKAYGTLNWHHDYQIMISPNTYSFKLVMIFV